MIEYRFIEGRYCPMVICDSCGDPITEQGVVAFGTLEESQWAPGVLKFFHKNFERPGCDDRSIHWLWDELSAFLGFLALNSKAVGLAEKDMKRLEFLDDLDFKSRALP